MCRDGLTGPADIAVTLNAPVIPRDAPPEDEEGGSDGQIQTITAGNV